METTCKKEYQIVVDFLLDRQNELREETNKIEDELVKIPGMGKAISLLEAAYKKENNRLQILISKAILLRTTAPAKKGSPSNCCQYCGSVILTRAV